MEENKPINCDKQINDLSKKSNVTSQKFDVCLLTSFYARNYGSILVAYAVHYLISELGYSILMLQKPLWFWGNSTSSPMYSQNEAQNFAKKYYVLSKPAKNIDELKLLNSYCDSFVVGSDLLFGWWLPFLSFCLLQFVNENKKKIAFATSFNDDKAAKYIKDNPMVKHYLNRFDYFSTREYIKPVIEDALNMKEKTEELIDPTLVVPNSAWEELIKESKFIPQTKNRYLLVYMLHNNEDKIKAAHYIASKLNLDIINIDPLNKNEQYANDFQYSSTVQAEDFLKLIHESDFVYTDSFHGVCFSFKFNKKFIVTKEDLAHYRFEIFNKLGLNSRMLAATKDIYLNDNILYTETNYNDAYNKLEKMANKSKIWLAKALK